MSGLVDRMMFPGRPTLAIDEWAPLFTHYKHASSRDILIYAHGNSCVLADIESYLEFLCNQLQVNVYAYEYPGYAKGLPSSQELATMAAREALRTVTQDYGYTPDHIILMGKSIGTGATCLLAAQNPEKRFKGVILMSPFTSITSLGTSIIRGHYGCATYMMYPFIAAATWSKYCNSSNLAKMNNSIPVLLIHGTEDDVIPFHMSDELKRGLETSRDVTLVYSEGGHNMTITDKEVTAMRVFIHRRRN